jgi:6-pyruvoyltetrahydropterin/6-carboxytetrahydropterin synthase
MSLNGEEAYCNPSVENIAKEVFLAMMVLFESYKNLRIHEVVIYETPNCSTICSKESISKEEAAYWMKSKYAEVHQYALDKGMFEYDDRKI